MALELTTDGDTGTSTTGETVLEMLGDHTETVLGSCFGWYLAFTRIVTGVDIVVKAGASIDILLGVKFELQAAAVVTIQPATVYTVQKGFVTRIGGLEELNAKTIVTDKITTHSKIITTGTYNITALNETGKTRVSSYASDTEEGVQSVENWSETKTIRSTLSTTLSSNYSMALDVGNTHMKLDPTGARINARLIELA